MKLDSCIWSAETYTSFITYLYSLQDLKYLEFHGRLLQDSSTLIGIRTPILKELAKKIAKNHPFEFLKYVKHETYEECVLHGLILGYMKIDFNTCILLLEDFLPFNTNWAINDITCANLKIWKKHLQEGLLVIKKYLQNDCSWVQRFGLVLLLDFYIQDDFIDAVLEISSQVSGESYYVGMANAWLLSVCYVKYPEKTRPLLEGSVLDLFTRKSAIRKIIESNRVPKEDKEQMRKLREQLGKSLI